MLFEGIYRRFSALKGGRSQIEARFTHQESLAIADVEPEGFEITRSGRRFNLGYSAAVTGIAPVQALPTTAAQWVIWNPDPYKAYVFDLIGVMLTSGTPAAGGILLAALIQAPAQVGGSGAGLTVASASNGAMQSKAIVKSAVTVTQPAAPAWFPVAASVTPNVGAFPSLGIENRDIRGKIIVPPGQGLALCVLAGAGTTPLFAPYASWVELETDLE